MLFLVEYAGHYVFNDGRGFGYDDGLYAALRVIEYMGHFPDKSYQSCWRSILSAAVPKILISVHIRPILKPY